MITLKPLFGLLAYLSISPKQLSEKSGVSYNAIMRMRKTNEFNASNLDKICLALNVNIDKIMRYESI